MRKNHKLYSTLEEEVEKAGGVLDPVSHKGHRKFRITVGNKSRILATGTSPSDHRAQKNMLAIARRIIRELKEEKDDRGT